MQETTYDKKSHKLNNQDKSFWGHLEDLRGTLIRSALAVVLLMIAAFILKDFIFDSIVLAPKEGDFITNRMFCRVGRLLGLNSLCIELKPLNIININLSGQFMMHLYMSFMTALIASSPYIIWEIWRFIKPALYAGERNSVKGIVVACILLFFAGALFGYYLIVPLTVNFFASYSVSETVVNQIALSSYVSTLFSVTLTTGVVFELPVFVFFLTRIGIVTPAFLKRNRKYTLIIILTIAAIITPPDVFSQIVVSIPLLLLYESTIIVCKHAMPKTATS